MSTARARPPWGSPRACPGLSVWGLQPSLPAALSPDSHLCSAPPSPGPASPSLGICLYHLWASGPLWASMHLRDPPFVPYPQFSGDPASQGFCVSGFPSAHPPGYAASSLRCLCRLLAASSSLWASHLLRTSHLHLWSLEAHFLPVHLPSAGLLGAHPLPAGRESSGGGGAKGPWKGCPAPRPEQIWPPLQQGPGPV